MINALLVRWSKGWHEVIDADSIAAHGRHEALLGLGAVESVEELERIAGRQLDAYGTVREEIAGNLAPVGAADTPYVAFEVGDTIGVPASDGSPSQERVTALTVAEDENGQLTWVPELRDVLLTQAERLEQGLKKMADGTLGGESRVATPTGQITTQPPVVRQATSVLLPTPDPRAYFQLHDNSSGLRLNTPGWQVVPASEYSLGNIDLDTGAAGVVVTQPGLYAVAVAMSWVAFGSSALTGPDARIGITINGTISGQMQMLGRSHAALSGVRQLVEGDIVRAVLDVSSGADILVLDMLCAGTLYTTTGFGGG